MKKLVYTLIGSSLAMLSIIYFLGKSSPEYKAIIDQLNPLVRPSESYVKTIAPSRNLEHGYFEYQQDAFDKEGQEIPLIFTADHKLKMNHYLKISHKGKHVITYEEVQKDELPQKVKEKLD